MLNRNWREPDPEFIAHMERVAAIVAAWPESKKQIVANSISGSRYIRERLGLDAEP